MPELHLREDWICPSCTFANDSDRDICEVCDLERPDEEPMVGKPTYVERIVAWEAGLVYHQAAARGSTPRDAGKIMRDWHKANPYPEPDAPKRKRKVTIKVDEPVAPPAPDSEPEEKTDE